MDHRTTADSRSIMDSQPWVAQPLQGSGGRHDSSERERERRSSRFSPMAPLGGGVVEMATRHHSTKATSGASMGRWFRTRGEIGAGLIAVDNRGALLESFIGP
jgi:hypothetical protein